jgi:hypothetical protein
MRPSERYSAWLKSDAGMTFIDWLKYGEPERDTTCGSCLGTGIGNPHTGSSCWHCRGRGYSLPAEGEQ